MNAPTLLAELLERELPISRRLLERVPEGRNDWKPHERSMPLGYLATLVATIPTWVTMMIRQDSLDLSPKDGAPPRPPEWRSSGELVKLLESSTAGAREALAGTTDEHLATVWKLLVAGRTVGENPRQAMIADTFCHLAHHRGQLSVYLRLLEVPLPPIYGPSADARIF
jgi:uncharacterized damage-inducible protein DinB